MEFEGQMALAFVFGFIQIGLNKLMMMMTAWAVVSIGTNWLRIVDLR